MTSTLSVLFEHGTTELTVSGGGEPLLHRDFAELLGYLIGIDSVHKRLYTNGSLLHRFPDIMDVFDYVRVSLNAGGARRYAAEHGTGPEKYWEILARVGMLERKHPGKLGVSAVVHSGNADSIPELFADCSHVGIHRLFLKPRMIGLTREPLPVVSLPSQDCSFALRTDGGAYPGDDPPPAIASAMWVVAPDGLVYPCCHVRHRRFAIAGLADLQSTSMIDAVVGSTRYLRILKAYARLKHACRTHDAWSGLLAQHGGEIAASFLSSADPLKA